MIDNPIITHDNPIGLQELLKLASRKSNSGDGRISFCEERPFIPIVVKEWDDRNGQKMGKVICEVEGCR
jgi:hypothetical protein